jgi:UDP-GlcNAc:undecaprenyl-phosphate GlcNAc-1-phosphate transferase
MQADRSHIHHRLIDMGLSQKQAVATLYVVSAILGLSAVVLTASGEEKAMLLFLALCIVAAVAARVVFPKEIKGELHEEMEELREHSHHEKKNRDGSAAKAKTENAEETLKEPEVPPSPETVEEEDQEDLASEEKDGEPR